MSDNKPPIKPTMPMTAFPELQQQLGQQGQGQMGQGQMGQGNQQGGFGQPPGSQPGGFGQPPGQQGGFGQPPGSQPGGFGQPPGQQGGFGQPPGSQPGGFGSPPPGSQPGGFGSPPPGSQPGGFGPPGSQPGGFGAPGGQPGGFGQQGPGSGPSQPGFGGGGPGSGGFGPPGSQPSGAPMAAPQKSNNTKYFIAAGGCGCLLLLGCIIGGAIMASTMGPGEEVASVDITPGQPINVSYLQDGNQDYEVWLMLEDVNHGGTLSLDGPLLLSAAGTPFGQYTMRFNASASGSPVVERSTSKRTSWTTTNTSASGNTLCFPIPHQASGATITITGTLQGPAWNSGRVRLVVTKK